MSNNYQPGEIDLSVIAREFGALPGVLYQPYRNIVGKIEDNGRLEFLKLATAPGAISQHIANEAEILKRRASGEYLLPVATPRLLREGVYDYQGQQLAWFTTEYIESKEIYPFTPEHPADSELFEHHLSTVVNTAIAIMDWPPEPLMPLDVPRQQVAHEVIDKVEFWIHDRLATADMRVQTAKAHELFERFFTNEQELGSMLDLGPSHGDFTPDVFRITPDKRIYLMDLEKVRMQWMKFYDIAYMYHRLYTKYQKPELAKTLLQKFITNYSQQHVFGEREVQNIRFALTQRLIGGYFDAVQDGVTSWALQDELSEKLLGTEESLAPLL